jgi:ankyrin repeat protein
MSQPNIAPAQPGQEAIGHFVNAAASRNYQDVLQYLDQYPSIINERATFGRSALVSAVLGNSNDIVKLLLDRGASVAISDNSSWSPLMYAAMYKNEQAVEMLLECGAALESTDKTGRTPLIFAAQFGTREIVYKLLERGADLDKKDDFGRNALKTAIDEKRDESVIDLLEQWPEIQRQLREKKELEAEIASFTPRLKRDLPAKKPISLPKRPAL